MIENSFWKTVCCVLLLVAVYSCKNMDRPKVKTQELSYNDVGIFNFDDEKAIKRYRDLNLDQSHPNLLNPDIAKADYDTVMSSWTLLHQQLGTRLSEVKFKWAVEDPTITIVHEIYFDANGRITHYLFNVMNDEVPSSKKEEFAVLLSKFVQTHRIGLSRDHAFAQCGKTRFENLPLKE